MGVLGLALRNITVLDFGVSAAAVRTSRARVDLWGDDAVFGTVALVMQTATSTCGYLENTGTDTVVRMCMFFFCKNTKTRADSEFEGPK